MKIRMNRQHLKYFEGETYEVNDNDAELWVAHGLATAIAPTPEQAEMVEELKKPERKQNKK